MIRSLYSGISGLRTHQVGLDVTANNIANVNTVAFKAGRATFKESMVQMLQGPSRPAGNVGGVNPMQIGLGVAVGSIDTMLRQGNFQTTGQITDLALEGRAYFAFSNGSGTFYSRNGALTMDSEGRLVSPNNGWRLQGKMANADGTYSASSVIGDIRIPWGDKAPAKATDLMAFACNLNSDSHALGTVTHTNRFLANAGILTGTAPNPADYDLTDPTDLEQYQIDFLNYFGGTGRIAPPDAALYGDLTDTAGNAVNIARYQDDFEAYLKNVSRSRLTDLFNENGESLGIIEGDTITFRLGDAGLPPYNFVVAKEPVENLVTGEVTMVMPTLGDLLNHLQTYLRAQIGSEVHVGVDPKNGGISIINNSGDPINGLQVSSSRPGSRAFVANAFRFPATIASNVYNPNPTNKTELGGIVVSNGTAPGIRIPAAAEDVLSGLFDASGRPLGFTDGDSIVINGKVGSNQKNVTFTYYDGAGLASQAAGDPNGLGLPPVAATTMADLMLALQEAFGLPPTDGTIYQRPSLSMKSSSDLVSDGIPIGSIVMRGQAEVAFSLTAITVMGKVADPNQANAPTRFSTNMNFTEVQSARNTGVHTMSDIIYDDSGAQHNVVITFTHTGTPGDWLWEITLVGGEEIILGGNRGRVSFMDGMPTSFTFDDGSNQFRFDPRNGASEVAITIDYGGPGSLLGITQFEKESTTAVKEQNGYGMGKLVEISIGESGEISGVYSNGMQKAIAQIYVAEFNNPAGLLKMGDSMFGVSNNSGHPAMYQPVHGSTTKIKPGALEMSNVELETEFTNMITIQRGYQASARVVSTSDQMLQELVQLVR